MTAAKFHDEELTDSYDASSYCPPKGSANVLPCKRNSRKKRHAMGRFTRTMSSRAIKSYQVTKFQYGLKGEHYVWLMNQFEPRLTSFTSWVSSTYEPGYRCSESPLLAPGDYQNFENPDIRSRFCRPPPEPEKCKVPEHQGPVGSGFQIAARAIDADRENGHVTTEIEVKGFSKFTKFAQCMLDVLREIEGIAHQPELDEELKRNAGGEDFAKWRIRFIDIKNTQLNFKK